MWQLECRRRDGSREGSRTGKQRVEPFVHLQKVVFLVSA